MSNGDHSNWQQQLSYAERTLRFTNAVFKSQSIPHKGIYYIRHHIVSVDYPVFNIIDFKESINSAISNGKKQQLKIPLAPLYKLTKQNINLYKKSIREIWLNYNGMGAGRTYKGLPIVNQRHIGSTVIRLAKSETIGYYLNPANNPNEKMEIYNEELYNYSKEIHTYLRNVAFKENWIANTAWAVRDFLVDIGSKTLSESIKVLIGFI